MGPDRPTASWRILSDARGRRYTFFCDLSGAAVCTTRPVQASDPGQELALAWQEARADFNQCQQCGRWICDAMYNPDTGQCVDCTPWLPDPVFCEHCGQRLVPNENYCRRCGSRISRIGVDELDC